MISNTRLEVLNKFLEKLNIQNNYLKIIKNKHIKTINEALTHSSANNIYNHERLEFLGDAVLRLASTEFIEQNFPLMKVGERSALRSHLVSDEWLAKVGKQIEIEKVLLIGPKASKDKSAKTTLQAESTEALIGALFASINDLKIINNWLTPYWEKESKLILSDPHRNNPKSALQEWSQKNGLFLPSYEIQEFSKEHGNPRRFFCKVKVSGTPIAEGWGGSRKEAEKEAAKSALQSLDQSKIISNN